MLKISTIDKYMISVFRVVMLTLTGSCVCAGVLYSTLKLFGFYDAVDWPLLILFFCTNIAYVLICLIFVKNIAPEGILNKKVLFYGKIYVAILLGIQYNFMVYLIPSRYFGYVSFYFLILVLLFLDYKLTAIMIVELLLSMVVLSFLLGNTVLPVNDELFIPELTLQIVVIILFYAVSFLLTFIADKFLIAISDSSLASKENEVVMLKYQNDIIEKYVLQRERSDQMIQIMSHDLKHHLQVWQAKAEAAGEIEAVQDIKAYAGRLHEYSLIDVGNETANALLNQKNYECLKMGVSLTVKGGFEPDLALNKIDMVALLGNLLDNAYEASLQVDDSSLRKIGLLIKREAHFLVVEIKNGSISKPVKKDGVYITSKTDRANHGIGMVSIEQVLKNFNGAMLTDYQDGIFSVSVMLRAYN